MGGIALRRTPRGARTARSLAVATALVLSLALAAAASAWRRPTSAESRAIRTAAVRSLHGAGWHARPQRLSTVRTSYRYASASVDNSRSGAGGEMILRRTSSGWQRLFLGTDGFCSAKAPRAVLRDLGFGC